MIDFSKPIRRRDNKRPALVWNTTPDENDYFSARPEPGRLYCVELDGRIWLSTSYDYSGDAVVDAALGGFPDSAKAKAACERHWQGG